VFQYGDWHFGQCLGFGFLSVQICPHRWHFACGNCGMSLVSIIFIFSILFYLYYCNYIVAYRCCSLSVLHLYSLLLCICVLHFVFCFC
jgi:hypothetical protein